ncbi:MAG: metallopeptidase family protein [Spirochaetes bacterium]|nr:metallopeptidase family protein [Spirochaetota bacterium]
MPKRKKQHRRLLSIKNVQKILNELVDDLPQYYFEGLNGGVILLPDAKISPESIDDDLYIMGEYHACSSMGRYISIYYGSFAEVYGHVKLKEARKELRDILLHEFTHHLEDRAGLNDLDQLDAEEFEEYRQEHLGNNKNK